MTPDTLMEAIIAEGKAQGIEITDGTNNGHYEKVKAVADKTARRDRDPSVPIVSPVGGWVHASFPATRAYGEIARDVVEWSKDCGWRRRASEGLPSATKATVSFGKRDNEKIIMGISEESGC